MNELGELIDCLSVSDVVIAGIIYIIIRKFDIEEDI